MNLDRFNSLVVLPLGWFVLALCALFVLWIVFEIGVGVVNSVSYHRWLIATMKKRTPNFSHRKLFAAHWFKFIKSLLSETWEYVGYRNDGSRVVRSEGGGIWRGIGDWEAGGFYTANPPEVIPIPDEDEDDHERKDEEQ